MNILLVEDDLKIADFIQEGLQQQGWSLCHRQNGRQGLHSAQNSSYDLIIADLMMPEMDGLTMIGKLRQQNNQTPVIILSARNSVDDRVLGLEKGGDDYLVKPFAMAELIARIQVINRRRLNSNELFLKCADLELDIQNRLVRRGSKNIELQPKEYALLEYMLRRKDKIITRRMIMENVWHYSFDPGTNVVDARLCKLRDKVDRGFCTKLIHTIRGAGYTIKDEQA
ncbi:MAG: response regulator transcription factor [Lentisphaerales bacterium]|nr:response regulator transcription factor [Lentisphaerales bacterium]